MKSTETIQTIANAYDEVPYESNPFDYTRPERLHAVGTLFGMNPPNIETARVLELGSSSGNNIVNFAFNYPKSHSIGVDISKVEIDHGLQMIKDIGIKNLELKHLSITDIDDSFGKFDYIICHGVFSWVPEVVRFKILEVMKNLLNKNGIAFVSYNTLPGWNMFNTIRDMMMFHASIFADTTSKVEQAKLFLQFVNEALEGSQTPYAKFLQEKVKTLLQYRNSYIRHEYLSPENTQFYFTDFMNLASNLGLQYLADVHLHTMYVGNLPSKAANQLQQVNDGIRTEQYMDFINNRQFRCTLLCHNDVKISRNIDSNCIKNFYITSFLSPAKPESEIDLTNSLEEAVFYLNGDQNSAVKTSSPIVKAIFYSYYDNLGMPIKQSQVINMASKKLPQFTREEITKEFLQSIPRLIFSQYLQLHSVLPAFVNMISDKPKVTSLCRYQSKISNQSNVYVTNQINGMVPLALHERHVIELLDGKNTIPAIESVLVKRIEQKELVIHENNEIVTDANKIKLITTNIVKASLEKFRTHYLLIS